jgi:hypothetical protein
MFMPFEPKVVAFVQAAVRLPHHRIRKIDRQRESLSAHRGVVNELLHGSNELRLQAEQLREYLVVAARMAAATGEADTGPTSLLPEEVAEAVLPAARAVLIRNQLEGSEIPGRAAAFGALTAAYLDILPERRS